MRKWNKWEKILVLVLSFIIVVLLSADLVRWYYNAHNPGILVPADVQQAVFVPGASGRTAVEGGGAHIRAQVMYHYQDKFGVLVGTLLSDQVVLATDPLPKHACVVLYVDPFTQDTRTGGMWMAGLDGSCQRVKVK